MSLSAVARLSGLGMTYHCPPAGENEAASLAAPPVSGQRAGTRQEVLAQLDADYGGNPPLFLVLAAYAWL